MTKRVLGRLRGASGVGPGWERLDTVGSKALRDQAHQLWVDKVGYVEGNLNVMTDVRVRVAFRDHSQEARDGLLRDAQRIALRQSTMLL